MQSVLSVNQLSVTLDSNAILTDISFSLTQGEILGLVGASGCGKTTLLNTLAGFITQQSGTIDLADKQISAQTPVVPEKRHIGMIFQDYALFPHLTVFDNIAFGLHKVDKSDRKAKVERLLGLLKLDDFADRYPHQLSGGQQQRVAIARALAPEPKLLLLDEPFSNIDARLRHELMLEIRQLLKSLNISAIIVTHNKDEVFTFADTMAVMSQGSFAQVGAPSLLCQQPAKKVVADFLQLGSFVPYQLQGDKLLTYLGQLPVSNNDDIASSGSLLVKPQYIDVSEATDINAGSDTSEEKGANMEITHIGVTEQGFHYLATCMQTNDLSFAQLSFYSAQVFSLGQQVSISIEHHQPIVFPH